MQPSFFDYALEYQGGKRSTQFLSEMKPSSTSSSDSKVQISIQKNNQYEFEQYIKIYKLATDYIGTDYAEKLQNISIHKKERGLCAEY